MRPGVPQRGCPLGQREVVAHERERDYGLGARDDHVDRLESQGAASTLSVVHDADGGANAVAVAEREHRDHEAAREIDLVVECPDERTVVIGQCGAGGERARRVGGGVAKRAVQDFRRDDAAPARAVERVERGQHDGSVGIAERRSDDRDTVLGRNRRRRSHDRQPPVRAVVRECGGE
jgi:hypothetical protein